ncbi:hypothetical protein [Solirubrobacter soli]|uniref:hypothetical protein n=1 Tax=Solirubrobacter soli TaxID=363832 RepID=UPI00041D935A|nr:hypothetical protein [Solirubrobacter soli]
MATSLRPLSVGEILDAGIKVFTRHWKPLAGMVAVLTGPVYIVYVLLIASIDDELLDINTTFSTSSSTTTTDTDATVLVGFGLSYVLLFITFLVAFVACFKAVSDAWLGSTPSVGRSLRFALRNSLKAGVCGIVAGIVVCAGAILCLVPGIWIGVAWCLCFPALLFERTGPIRALGRSYSLTKQRWWGSFLVWIVGYLLVSIVGAIVQLGLLGIADAIATDNTIVAAIATVIGSTASAAVSYPFLAAVLTILYFDQRVRKEGFDLQLQAEGFGLRRDPDAPLPAPLIGDEVYTPEQRAAAPYWPPPPGWTPPPAEPAPQQWASSSGWSAPSHDDHEAAEPPLWGQGERPQSYPTRSSGDPLRQDPPPTDPLPPRDEDDPPPSYPSWSAKPPPKKDDDDEGPNDRASWLPPEAPRGPGGL